ncbi:MAG: CAP domain-containing protein [bacterium]|nr:CAP domain-containing protein [bacterium]
MKTAVSIITIIFTFLSARAQSDVEKLLFSDINKYRVSKGLQTLKWDSSAYNASKHHANYLSIINNTKNHAGLISHDEKIDIENFQEYNVDDRIKFFIPKNKNNVENVASGGVPNFLGKENVTSQDSVISKIIFDMWKTSKGHNINMKVKNFNLGACAISYSESIITFNTALGTKTRTIKSYYAVFVAYY